MTTNFRGGRSARIRNLPGTHVVKERNDGHDADRLRNAEEKRERRKIRRRYERFAQTYGPL